MKLAELYSKPIKEAMEEMTLVDMKVHTDDAGNVKAVELKYTDGNWKTDTPKFRNLGEY